MLPTCSASYEPSASRVTSLREIALGRVSSIQSVEVSLKEHLADQRGLERARKQGAFQRGRG